MIWNDLPQKPVARGVQNFRKRLQARQKLNRTRVTWPFSLFLWVAPQFCFRLGPHIRLSGPIHVCAVYNRERRQTPYGFTVLDSQRCPTVRISKKEKRITGTLFQKIKTKSQRGTAWVERRNDRLLYQSLTTPT